MSQNVPDTIVMLGKTGSGKGTQAELIAGKLEYKTFSTGDKFREIMHRDTSLGRRTKDLYERGIIFPHWFASYLFEEFFLNLDDGVGVVTEGVGRTREEAAEFDEVMSWLGREYVVIELAVSDDEVIKRQLKRGRSDSNTEEKLKTRLDEYRKNTQAAIDFFKENDRLVSVDGEPAVEEVFKNVCKVLDIT